MRKLSITIATLVAVAAALLPAGAASAAPATIAGSPWSAAHGTASASGTAEWVSTGWFSKKLVVDGELANTGADCYYTVLSVVADLVPLWAVSPTQCGPGAAPVHLELMGAMTTTRGSVRVCRGEGPARGQGTLSPFPPDLSDCGVVVWVP